MSDALKITVTGDGGSAESMFQSLGASASGLSSILTTGLGVALGGLITTGFGAAKDALGSFIDSASQSEDAMAGLDAVLKSTGAAATQQGLDYEAASHKMVSGTAMSTKELTALSDKLEKAKARVADLDAALASSKHPTESMTLNLQKAREEVTKLSDEMAKGSTVITQSLAKSMGLAAPAVQMTRDALVGLSTELQNTTKFSDETAQKGEEVLLTFRDIGANIFPDAMHAAADLSTVMGTDLQSSIVMIGKALNDPVQGMTALTRVGVSFTQSQKDMVKHLQDTGDKLGAQKIILNELKSEFGGAAEAAGKTFSGQLVILGNRFDDVKEKIGGAFLPLLKEVATDLADALNNPAVQQAIDSTVNWVEGGVTRIKEIIKDIQGGDFVLAGFNLLKMLGFDTPTATEAMDKVRDLAGDINKIGNAFTTLKSDYDAAGIDGILGGLSEMGVSPDLVNALQGVVDSLKKLGPASKEAITEMHSALVERKPEFSKLISDYEGAFTELGGVISQISGAKIDIKMPTMQQVFGMAVDDYIRKLREPLTVYEQFKSTIQGMKSAFNEGTVAVWSWLWAASQSAMQLGTIIKTAFDTFVAGTLAPFSQAWQSVEGFIKGVVSALQSLSDLLGVGAAGLREALQNMFGGARADGGAVMGGMSYLVGERGPEIFAPQSAGTIIPNHMLGGGGQTIVLNYYSNGLSLGNRKALEEEFTPIFESVYQKSRLMGNR